MKQGFLKGVAVGSVVSTVTLAAAAAFAGSGVGAVFNLGQNNTVNVLTRLTGSVNDAQLRVTNNGTGALAAGIAIDTTAGKPPLVVNSTARVAKLNADTVDGVHAAALQKRVTGECDLPGDAINSIAVDGTTTCARSGVIPVFELQPYGQTELIGLYPVPVTVISTCYSDWAQIEVFPGPYASRLNWMFSEGGTRSTVNSGGVAVAPSTGTVFNYTGRRLDGQWIVVIANYALTLNLHTAHHGDLCEVFGTASWGAV